MLSALLHRAVGKIKLDNIMCKQFGNSKVLPIFEAWEFFLKAKWHKKDRERIDREIKIKEEADEKNGIPVSGKADVLCQVNVTQF